VRCDEGDWKLMPPVKRSRPPTTDLFPYSLDELTSVATYTQMLTKVGTGDLPGVTRVATCTDAMKHTNTDKTSEFLVESMKFVGERVQQIDYNLYNLWNIFAAHGKTHLAEINDKYIFPRIPRDIDARDVAGMVNWVIVGATIERCYAIVGVVEPMWATRWCQLIVDGYFPCGWEGEFPNGRLIVY
jgi:hypothetical protein